MSKSYLVLSALMAAITGVHVFLGGPQYADAFAITLENADLRAMSLVLWHAVTVALILFALAYLWLAFRRSPELVAITSLLQLGWAGLFLFYGVTQLGELVTQPQWVLFIGFPCVAVFSEWLRDRRNPAKP
ncbi:hypothetical protein J7443_12970 [Tropicibacter sp. R15_0]|uniref:hypothetical protein n=1 Tax=Tropicibacter sp. R15_0 TaxID=2821101 RepID=UPI001ADA44DF|nr:hypothetical protein [Tropicibacter sp. R15_0]MBO9466149.1 hypothetical protein [Tropicibacter sp. R15_0]